MNKGILFVTGLVLSVLVMSGFVLAADPRQAEAVASVTVPGYRSLTLTNEAISFGTLVPGTNNNMAVNPQLIARIGPETNVETDVNVQANSTSFTDGSGHTLNIANNFFFAGRLDLVAPAPSEFQEYAQANAKVACTTAALGGGACTIWHRLNIPQAQQASTVSPYTISVTVSATD